MSLYPGMNQKNTALVVIDPVNSCAHENCESPELKISFRKIREMLPRLNDFLTEYRQKMGGLVVLTTITPWNKEHLTNNLNELYTDPQCTYYSDDSTGFDEQFHTVVPESTDLIFVKNTYSTFADGRLTQILKDRGVRYIIICGIFTDGCVLASVVDGFSQGFNFVILKDLVETTDVPIRQEIQKNLIAYTFPVMYGKTVASVEIF